MNDLLPRLVASIAYKPGWRFKLGGPRGRFLCIYTRTIDSRNPALPYTNQHMFEIPDGLDLREFARWTRERLIEVETHEVGEFLTIQGRKPFHPNHDDEGSPYAYVERWET